MAELDYSAIRRRRMCTQRLTGIPFDSPTDVVDHLTAVQAQDYHGAKWGIAQRTSGTTSSAFDDLFNGGELLRTHVLRPTWHFVRPADIRWLLALTAPRVHSANAYSYRKFELDNDTLRRSTKLLIDSLEGGQNLTRAEVGRVLEFAGIVAAGLRLGYILMHAELDGLICSGPLRGKQHTYALIDERAPAVAPIERDEALARLTFRYFDGHGPATGHDFAWWSGLTVSDAKRGVDQMRASLTYAEFEGSTYWFTENDSPGDLKGPIAHLLPNYDEYLIAFKNHSAVFDQVVLQRHDRGDDAIQAHILLLGGMVVGGWQRLLSPREAKINLSLLRPLSEREQTALSVAFKLFGQFIELPVSIELPLID
jgi:hypothetical protein